MGINLSVMINADRDSNTIVVKKIGSKSQDRGFTIIEALISIILFMITLTGSMAIYFNADRIVTLTTHKRLAIEIANLTMEEFRAQGFAAFDGDFTLADPGVPEDFDYPDPINPLKVGEIFVTRTITVENNPLGAAPNYKEITVKIDWIEADQIGQRYIEIVTILAP